jgi:hypothetical protein
MLSHLHRSNASLDKFALLSILYVQVPSPTTVQCTQQPASLTPPYLASPSVPANLGAAGFPRNLIPISKIRVRITIFSRHSLSVVVRSIKNTLLNFRVHVERCGTKRFLFFGGASISGHRHDDSIARAQQILSSAVIILGKCNALYTNNR